MEVKTSRTLTLRDLPRIESPFFAASEIERRLSFDTFLDNEVRRLLNPFPSAGQRREIDGQQLRKCLKGGDLFLVFGVCDGKPFSPLVVWEEVIDAPNGGQWRLNCSDCIGLSHLESQVSRLNDWAITPEAIRVSGPGEVGHLGVSSFDMDLRERRADERYLAQPEAQRQPSTPIGGLASVARIPVSAANNSEGESEQAKANTTKAIHLEVGVFTDGTLNNAGNIEIYRQQVEEECLAPRRRGEIDDAECERRLALLMGASYANAESNVYKLWDLYERSVVEKESGPTTHVLKIYAPGAGSKTGGSDSLAGMATGLGETGVVEQVKRAFSDLADQARSFADNGNIDRLMLDLFGFSRGAAAARHAAHEIGLGPDGELGRALAAYGTPWPSEVVIRFVGLFDTVAGIVNVRKGDLAAGNDQNAPVRIYLDPANVKAAVHLTALDERRANFALNSLHNPDGSLPNNFREIALPGAHSDIGGGYHETQTEDLLLSPVLTLNDNRTEWPEETPEWDNLATLEQMVESEGWIGSHSLTLPSGELPTIEIHKEVKQHPTPYGRVDLSLRMKREVRGEYSRVNLRLMHTLAVQKGVPLKTIDSTTFDVDLPEDLTAICEALIERVQAGEDNASEFSVSDLALIKQRYTHHSDHYNLAKFLVGDMIVALEVPLTGLSPFRPTKDLKRTIYANEKEVSA